MNRAVIIFLVILWIIIFFCGKLLSKSLLHPMRIISMFWMLLTMIPILFWDIRYDWNGNGIVWIAFANLFSILGGLTAYRFKKTDKNSYVLTMEGHYEFKKNWWILYAFAALGLLSVIERILLNGFHFADFTSLDRFLSMNAEMAYRRYNTEEISSTLTKILSIFSTACSVAGGYSYNFAKDKKHKIVCLLCFLPTLLDILFTNAKSGFFSTVILWLAGWCVSKIYRQGKLPIIKTKTLFIGGIAVIVMLAFLYFIMLVRIGDFSSYTRKIVNNKFLIYGFGEIVEFDGWFAGGDDFHSYGLGVNTYMVLPRALGLVIREQGVYTYYIYGYGNVFTAYRGLICDFGVLGSLLWLFFRGFITQICIYTISKNKGNIALSKVLVVCYYFFGLYGFVISPWIYTTYVISILLYYFFILVFNKRIFLKSKRNKNKLWSG